jgi:hypothetical protein
VLTKVYGEVLLLPNNKPEPLYKDILAIVPFVSEAVVVIVTLEPGT